MLDMKRGELLRLKCEIAIRKQLSIATDRLNDVTAQIGIYVDICTYICICVYMYMYAYMNVCIYICI
jgi:hypothetical protein